MAKRPAPVRKSFPAPAARRTKPSQGMMRSQRARDARAAEANPAARAMPAPRATDASPSTSARAVDRLPSSRLKVRATQMGYYDERRRREGDVFILKSAKDFSERWMEYTDGRTPLKHTGPQEAINRKHDEILGGTADRPADPDAHSDDDDVT